MRTLAPAGGLTGLKNEMDRLIERFWDGDFALPAIGEWMPALDLSEDVDFVKITMDVPGFDPKDVHITLRDNLLTIRGEKKVEAEKKEEKFYRTERATGSFTRMVRLPVVVEAAKVQATFKNGVLNILLPKAPEAKGTEIPVKIV